MKILLISYDFHPEAKPNSYRWFNVAKKLIKDGAEIYVITANKNQFPDFENINGMKVYRTTEFLAGTLKYQYRDSLSSTLLIKNKGQGNTIKVFLKSLTRKMYYLTWSKLYWPDYSFLWIFSALPVAKKIIKMHKIDRVITVSWPFSAHIIGYLLKRKFKNLFWLADTIDPFSFNVKVNNSFLYSKLNMYYEHKIFCNADLSTVLTYKIKEKYSLLFPDAKYKIMVNKNVFIPVDFDYQKVEKDGDEKIRILFLGSLSNESRSPVNLLVLINNLLNKFPSINMQIDFYGDFTDTIEDFRNYPMLLNKYIFLNGFINRQQVNEAIKNADVLLNIGNNNEYQEPSKLIEYMYSGKKILNICNIIEDSSAELLEIYPLHLNILPTELEGDLVLKELFNFFKNSDTINKTKLQEILKSYLLDEVSDKYLNFLLNKKSKIY